MQDGIILRRLYGNNRGNNNKVKDEISELKYEHAMQMQQFRDNQLETESRLVNLIESKLSKLTKAFELSKELDQQYVKKHIPGYKPPKPLTPKEKEFIRKTVPNLFQ